MLQTMAIRNTTGEKFGMSEEEKELSSEEIELELMGCVESKNNIVRLRNAVKKQLNRRSTFNPIMFVLARESRGFTRCQIAKKTGFDTEDIKAIENGWRIPTKEDLQVFAELLRYLPEFFHNDGERNKVLCHYSYEKWQDDIDFELGIPFDGEWSFDGEYKHSESQMNITTKTTPTIIGNEYSIEVFQWLLWKNTFRFKKGKQRYIVRGPVSKEKKIIKFAQKLCDKLNDGKKQTQTVFELR